MGETFTYLTAETKSYYDRRLLETEMKNFNLEFERFRENDPKADGGRIKRDKNT